MFRRLGVRLALLNAAVVVAVLALTGLATFALLQRALSTEVERALRDRVDSAAIEWAPRLGSGEAAPEFTQVAPNPDSDEDDESDDEHEDERHEDDEQLETSDTFVFVFDRAGELYANVRSLDVRELPDLGMVHAALDGRATGGTRNIGGHEVRLWTQPVYHDGSLVGVVQAIRGTGEQESQRRQVLLFTSVGVLLGTAVAVPAGWLLSRRAMQPIEAAFARQRAFVSDASHELRTPLTLIRAQAELLSRTAGDRRDLADDANVIRDEVDRMNRLVSDLVLLARMDEETGRARQASVANLSALLQASVDEFQPAAAAAGIALSFQVSESLWVRGDDDGMRQVMRNLIDNALRYTPAGGSVRVEGTRDGQEIVVRVQDTGIGLSQEEQDRVFDRFFRTDRARARASGGTGLGLSIVRAIIESAGGRIGVESRQGEGSTFWFSLPAAPAQQADVR